MNVLRIDTSSNKRIKVELEISGRKHVLKEKIGAQKAQVVLPIIDKLLERNNLSLDDLHEINVNQGPGSYTGLKVGVAIANALSFALGIPVNGKKPGQFVEPRYE